MQVVILSFKVDGQSVGVETATEASAPNRTEHDGSTKKLPFAAGLGHPISPGAGGAQAHTPDVQRQSEGDRVYTPGPHDAQTVGPPGHRAPSGYGEQALPGSPKQPGPRGAVVMTTVLVVTTDDADEDEDNGADEVVPAPVVAVPDAASRPPHPAPVSRTATTYPRRMPKCSPSRRNREAIPDPITIGPPAPEDKTGIHRRGDAEVRAPLSARESVPHGGGGTRELAEEDCCHSVPT
jgi:hypothetical protein